MQPQVLNAITFSSYGRPLRRALETLARNCEERTIPKEKQFYTQMCRYDGNVYLEPVDGVGIIYIVLDMDRDPEIFVFDKIVEIYAGSYFCVASYGYDFTFRVYSEDSPRICESPKLMASRGIEPKLKVEKLYTVLYQEKERGFVFKGEKHTFWELTYVDKGCMVCTVDGTDVRLASGDLVFFAGGQFHSQRTEGESIVSFVTVTFDLNISRNDVLEGKVIHVDETVHQILKCLLKEYHAKDIYNEEMIASLLIQILVYSLRDLQEHTAGQDVSSVLTSNVKSRMVSEALQLIDRDIGGPLTIGELAQKLCVSASLLSKAFKSETGYNVSEYIQNRRMEMAKDLIRQGNYSITQISDMLGYCSVCYFSAAFKKKFSITPSDFSRAVNQE